VKESEVVSIIGNHFNKENWNFWIDEHPIHRELGFKKHSILIGGARPDIYGTNNFNQIFAVEVKGIKDYKKAIGQALIYKSGVNISYIGGLESKLDLIKDIALSSGLGLVYVDEENEKVGKIENPIYNIYPKYLEDIKNEINVLKNQKKKSRSFSSFGRTHILNYFCPIFLYQGQNIKSKTMLKNELEMAQWKNKTYSQFINGANIIGLLNLEGKGFRISKINDFCLEYFKSINIESLSELQNTIDRTGRNKTVYSELPHLAKFIQLIYFQNPDFKRFISILLDFNKKEIIFGDILSTLVLEFPNLFLNFFVKSKMRNEVFNIFMEGKKEKLLTNYRDTIGKYGHYNFIFAFKRHLVHLGILSQENTTFYGKTEDLT
jgi:hypothetical protein